LNFSNLGRQQQKEANEEKQNHVYLSPDGVSAESSSTDDMSPAFSNTSGPAIDSANVFGDLSLDDGSALYLRNLDAVDMNDIYTKKQNDPSPPHHILSQMPSISLFSSEHLRTSIIGTSSEFLSGHIDGTVSLGEHRGENTIDEMSRKSSLLIDEIGWQSTLHIAAQRGHERIIRLLLERNIDCNEKDSDGLTPLIHATIQGHEAVVSLLLAHNAYIGEVDGQCRTAIHWAVLQRREAVLRILLSSCTGEQPFIDTYDKSGKTPLHLAVDMGFESGVQALLQCGANLHCKALKP
jgi:hypothetical protein